MRLSRRDLVASLGVVPLVANAPGQATPVSDKRQKAEADIRDTSAKLAQIAVPMSVEPAFSFKP